MEFNKFAAAILVAGLIAMITGKVSTTLYYGGEHAHHGEAVEAKRGYTIDVGQAVAGDAGGGGAAAEIKDISVDLASADVAAGESVFKQKCTTCHNADKGGANKTGPGLWGVVGRPKGSKEGFNYSKNMKEKGGNWDFDSLNHFIHGPKQYVAGTMMAFAGIKNDKDRANLIAYLRTMSDAPVALPAAK